MKVKLLGNSLRFNSSNNRFPKMLPKRRTFGKRNVSDSQKSISKNEYSTHRIGTPI